MKLVYLARNPLDAQVVRGALESRGIETQVRGESLWGVRGALPVSADTAPSVWVSDADEEAALNLIARRRLPLAALAPGSAPAAARRSRASSTPAGAAPAPARSFGAVRGRRTVNCA